VTPFGETVNSARVKNEPEVLEFLFASRASLAWYLNPFPPEMKMACRICGSENQVTLRGELTASFPSLPTAKLAPLYVCQDLRACLACGFTELQIPAAQLQALKKQEAAGKGN